MTTTPNPRRRYSPTRWAAQVRRNNGAALLTLTVTDSRVPLFDTAVEAYESLLTPPADHPAITLEMWRAFHADATVEVWKIYVDRTGTRRATYVPVSEQPHTTRS